MSADIAPIRSKRSNISARLAAFAGATFALLILAITAAPASAGQTHVFLETFGSAAQPTVSGAISLAVDQSTGDVLVVEAGDDRIARYHSDGTPANFSALSVTNLIDGKPGEADQTPQSELGFDSGFGSRYSQIAVDNSGTITDGNIYVTQNAAGGASPIHAVDVFASSGAYLGQVTGNGSTNFGSGPPQEGEVSPCGVAVDSAGDLYVGGYFENKIYKFNPSANPPSNADQVATFSSPRPCQLAAGAGPSAGSLFAVEYGSNVSKLNSSSGAFDYVVFAKQPNDEAIQVAVNPVNGHLNVATGGSNAEGVLDYDASGSFAAALISRFAANPVVAVSGVSGKVYVQASGGHLAVYSPLVPLPDVTTNSASAINETTATLNATVNTNGELLSECKFEYGPTSSYGATVPCAESPAEIGTGTSQVHADLGALAPETVYHFRILAANPNGNAEAPGEDRTFQTVSKPEILAAWAQDVSLSEATLKAQINPQSATTTYRFEWGLTAAPYEHSTADVSIGAQPTAHTVSLFLQGLAPLTTYHYRLVASNECHPQTDPGSLCTSESPDYALTTFGPSATPESDCPNQALRYGPSAFLPDCRAYEMVSPVDKNGGDIVTEIDTASRSGGYIQARPDGDALTYTALTSFAGEPNSFRFNQYLAARTERGEAGEGWATQGVHPPVTGQSFDPAYFFGGDSQFMAFTPDLCSAWLIDNQTPPLTEDAQEGVPNLYRRDNCDPAAGDLEALTTVPLPPGTPSTYVLKAVGVEGASDDARHALFVAGAQLTPDARPYNSSQNPDTQLYDRFDGALHLVSVLPDGSPADPVPGDGQGVADPLRSKVGAGASVESVENLASAVSPDGSHVYWTTGEKLYLRMHPEQGIVAGECETPTAACTVPVSAGAGGAVFWAASTDGDRALYTEGGQLFEFDLGRYQAGEPPRLIAAGVSGVAGASQDLAGIYFISTEALPASGQNSEGEEAHSAEPNLYLAEGPDLHFVATLAATDVVPDENAGARPYSLTSPAPSFRATRVTPDGARIAFESRASLTGYDNNDSADGTPTVEVFTYQAGGALTCVSCNPSGARPHSGELLPPYSHRFESPRHTGVPAAAWIPTWERQLHASNVLSADGQRLFFNSNDALLPRDANGAQDVYEWEAAGTGRCKAGDAAYFAQNGGCLYLISTGESPFESEFWEASANGRDVFFTTASSLLPQDPGSIDLYDARIDGGFPQPNAPAACEGEACQSPPSPPHDSTPASSAFEGAGNVRSIPPRHCRKPHVRRRGRCVPRHHKHRRANHDRRTSR